VEIAECSCMKGIQLRETCPYQHRKASKSTLPDW
jgi:hypothetical protein